MSIQLNWLQVDTNQVVENLKDDQRKFDAPELNVECHSKGVNAVADPGFEACHEGKHSGPSRTPGPETTGHK